MTYALAVVNLTHISDCGSKSYFVKAVEIQTVMQIYGLFRRMKHSLALSNLNGFVNNVHLIYHYMAIKLVFYEL